MGVHMIDTLQYFAGPIKLVFCFSKKVTGRQKDLDDATMVAAEFEKGPLGYIGFSMCVPKVCTAAVFGDKASAWSEKEGTKLYQQKNNEVSRTEIKIDQIDTLVDKIKEFARCVRDKSEPETGGLEGLAVVEVMEALYESHQTGKVVDVSDYRTASV